MHLLTLRKILYLALLPVLLYIPTTYAELQFPKLTGRVVDEVNLLNQAQKNALETKLEAHEAATSNQVVVAIVKNLQGTSIDDYGYQLGRAWGIGQKGKNNGVVLLVAPNQRKVRIEVGYGLEGTLTDAISANIIQTRILPLFREGEFANGIVEGASLIIDALGGQYQLKPDRTERREKTTLPWWVIFFIPFIFLRRSGFGYYGHGHGGGRGGFSGGGGSFGGGGASGGW